MSRHRMKTGRVMALVWLTCGAPATALAGCSLSDVTGLNFGSYDPLSSSPATTLGNITLCCDGLGPSDFATVELGSGTSQSPPARVMTQGPETLSYNLYLDSGYSQIWGDGFNGTGRYGPVQPSNGSCSSLPVYGSMPAGQTIPAGSYADTLTVTLTF